MPQCADLWQIFAIRKHEEYHPDPLVLDEYHLTRVIIISSITPAEYHPSVYRQGPQSPQTQISGLGRGHLQLRSPLRDRAERSD